MKRKPPKNLRPYATPSGRKARMVAVWGNELEILKNANGELGCPHLTMSKGGLFYADTDELRKWRASQTTSEAK